MSKFTVAGVSTQNGITKVRFANDIVSRTKLLAKGGHSPLELVELPKAMTKEEACQHLLTLGGKFKAYTQLITETMDKKAGKPVVTKAPKAAKPAKVAKPVKATKPAKVIKSKPEVEEDLEVQEIKQLVG